MSYHPMISQSVSTTASSPLLCLMIDASDRQPRLGHVVYLSTHVSLSMIRFTEAFKRARERIAREEMMRESDDAPPPQPAERFRADPAEVASAEQMLVPTPTQVSPGAESTAAVADVIAGGAIAGSTEKTYGAALAKVRRAARRANLPDFQPPLSRS